MQQFVVPQFIDVEDKIIGPVTTRQFVILLVDAFFVFVSYKFSDFSLFIALFIFELIVGATLAFVRVNGRPFHFFMLNLIQTLRRPRLRVWRKQVSFEEALQSIHRETPASGPAPVLVKKPPLTTSRLSQLALVVDTGGVYREET